MSNNKTNIDDFLKNYKPKKIEYNLQFLKEVKKNQELDGYNMLIVDNNSNLHFLFKNIGKIYLKFVDKKMNIKNGGILIGFGYFNNKNFINVANDKNFDYDKNLITHILIKTNLKENYNNNEIIYYIENGMFNKIKQNYQKLFFSIKKNVIFFKMIKTQSDKKREFIQSLLSDNKFKE
jgi:hypothetical protein